MPKRKVFAVLPVYNVEGAVASVIRKVSRHVDAVIAVNDGSTDGSLSVINGTNAVVLDNVTNRGLGFTLRRGAEEAASMGADIIVTIDSDGQHDADDIPKLLDAIEKGGAEIAIGSRPLDRNMPFIKKLGNVGLRFLSRLLFSSFYGFIEITRCSISHGQGI